MPSPESFESAPDIIPNKEEVLEVIALFSENSTFVRELSDDQGLYLLEVKVEGEKPGETTQYEYMRAGTFPNGNASGDTAIHRVYYENGVPVGGDKVAILNQVTKVWDELK